MISLDSETTGLDLRHGARPFYVTSCDSRCPEQVLFYEWDVDPLTRIPIIPEHELLEVRELVLNAEELVLQNAKFDVGALESVGCVKGNTEWPWERTYDTLFSGHLLASNQPHDLTTQAMVYLGVNIKPYEEGIKNACNEGRRIARSKLPSWLIAKAGLSGMPSAKESCWAYDMWLPRAIVKEAIHKLRFDLLPDHPQQPIVLRVNDPHIIRIDRGTKWGNPYHIGKDGTREEVIKKYAQYIWGNQDLLRALPELYGKRLGCHCMTELCHGQVLRALCHPWMTVLQEYSNADSMVTLPLHERHMQLIENKGLGLIYLERLKQLPIIYQMESGAVSQSIERTMELKKQYTESSELCKAICINVADGEIDELPKNGSSNALKHVVFEKFKLKSSRMTDKGNPSLDKFVLDEWLETLPQRSKAYTFIKNLKAYRKRQTALSYIDSYEKFWIPLGIYNSSGEQAWCLLYPSLNPTGTNTLRWTSKNPNEQQISKQEIEEIGYSGESESHSARYMFGPIPGREWWSCDANNIELRIPAYEAGETDMIALFERPNDYPYFGSNHLLISHILHKEKFEACRDDQGRIDGRIFKKQYNATWYQWVKNGNFAVQYGAIAESGTADKAYHLPGAQIIIEGKLRNIKNLSAKQIDFANHHGYVETIPDRSVGAGRGYPLYCTRTKWNKISPTIPLSYHIQGTAMWWMGKAMTRCYDLLNRINKSDRSLPLSIRSIPAVKQGLGYRMTMQIHDELVFDFPKGQGSDPWKMNSPIINEIRRLMALGGDDIDIPTPVGCEYHEHSWGEGKSVAS